MWEASVQTGRAVSVAYNVPDATGRILAGAHRTARSSYLQSCLMQACGFLSCQKRFSPICLTLSLRVYDRNFAPNDLATSSLLREVNPTKADRAVFPGIPSERASRLFCFHTSGR